MESTNYQAYRRMFERLTTMKPLVTIFTLNHGLVSKKECISDVHLKNIDLNYACAGSIQRAHTGCKVCHNSNRRLAHFSHGFHPRSRPTTERTLKKRSDCK